MIVKLSPTEKEDAENILKIQIPAYKVEAKLINFDGIPQLKDTIDEIMKSDETFIGYMVEGELAGFISYIVQDSEIEICRLVVHPGHFRKGIAKKLLGFIVGHVANYNHKVMVSTGSKNFPAKSLYHSFGFTHVKEIEVSPGIFISLMELETRQLKSSTSKQTYSAL
ncbi:GNAT family N-acetyltransferase [Bacillus sp. V5-8f]|uniref:GNAT family N-acetyltransferase n=1 Tax=Bacillus sp. V5-8f TaxID=2053044 RepID=UPI000C766DE6|nr:GNAT family N-acetyltransferase [Bacillus sp. V5-8f]PLT33680.1 GNAT family N-acetyltransferase [Bacillus sp. V5-8f]